MIQKPLSRGFTLIELMIVVAVIGILAAIAYPNYREHVRKGERADAQRTMHELAQFLERNFTANNRFHQRLDNNGAWVDIVIPANLLQSPQQGAARYGIQVNPLTANTYTITATPVQADVRCGNLTLTHTGLRGSLDNAYCWRS